MTIMCDNKECIYNDGLICECDYVEIDSTGCCKMQEEEDE